MLDTLYESEIPLGLIMIGVTFFRIMWWHHYFPNIFEARQKYETFTRSEQKQENNTNVAPKPNALFAKASRVLKGSLLKPK